MWEGEVQERENGELWGKSNYCGKWFPLLSTAVHRGLFHPNCRHSIGLYRDGDKLPEPVDNTESERLYALEQKQRRLENNVRKARRRAEGLTDPENAKKAAKEVRDAQKKLRKFIDKVNADEGRTVLKRDYERERIYSGKSVDKSAESGIIEKEELPRKLKNSDNAVDWGIIKTNEYSQKFTKLTTDKKISSAIEIRAKWALNNRDGKSTKELYAISLESGREISRITDQHFDSAVIRTTKFTR